MDQLTPEMNNRKKRVLKAAMSLYRSRKAHLQSNPCGLDCEGEYWIVRNTRAMKEFRKACAMLAVGGTK